MLNFQALALTLLTMLSMFFMIFGINFFFISEEKQIPTSKTVVVTLPCILISVLIIMVIINVQGG